MFDIGFGEIFLIAVVALLVLGPERLPKAARFAGLWVRRARAQWYSVKAELENELADDELKRSLRQARSDLQDARDALAQGGTALQQQFEETRAGLRDAVQSNRVADDDGDAHAPPADPVADAEQAALPFDDHDGTPDSRPTGADARHSDARR
ncbi:Sec-independent protein translocase protein TatB [Lysobacter solisilvae (ex Woo and Kim 2020)]|uniref:Sec-independent protein translocase protein TatB n=1 Tax=Agrilutibacter terrestris TaxID=2865112 RepID=A0A7H0FTT9_9GAMM|nr:Sec-independent protein translocase protein TatB [Lysobacter terrestris]QNP39455.1 twin-arginine translocase subunit TatB [Lysobacter terrestris]